MWKKCSEGQSVNNCSGKAKDYTWDDAMKRSKLVSFAGKPDWRLPTIQELRTLVYCSNGTPTSVALSKGCNKDFTETTDGKPAIRNDIFPNTVYSWHWSSSPYASFSNGAWVLDFYGGYDARV